VTLTTISVVTTLDIIIPCLNEERQLPVALEELSAFLKQHLKDYRWRIVVADNGSSDRTNDIAIERSVQDPEHFEAIHLKERGRGRALKAAWMRSQADVVAYMDVDLSTDLAALPQLVEAVTTGGHHIAIGSRLARGAQVVGRPLKREITSRGYMMLLHAFFNVHFTDAQCGFKALKRSAADKIVPLVQDTGWFFDTEMLLIAERNGYLVKDVPVQWRDDPDTRVQVVKTAIQDLRGIWRLRFGGIPRIAGTSLAPMTKPASRR